MDSNPPKKTSLEWRADVSEEAVVNEINFCTDQVKEDIHSTFSRHKKSLDLRERCLLDQLDSVKDSVKMSVCKRQISMAEMKGRLEECVKFAQLSKDNEFKEGVEKLSETLDPLAGKIKEYHQDLVSVPSIKFVHDKVFMKNAILEYGSLETDFKSAIADDGDSCGTDYSWDLVDEKSEPCDKSAKNGFHLVNYTGNEIEDMDVSRLLEDDSPGNELRNVCRANELCSSISECVCDVPCLDCIPAEKSDPVSHLDQKLKALCQSEDDIVAGIEKSHDSEDLTVDPVSQISAHLKAMMSGHSGDSKCYRNAEGNSKDFIAVLNQKLQSIIDGDFTGCNLQRKLDAGPVYADRVSYRFLPWANTAATPRADDDDIIARLHQKLGKIYQNGKDIDVLSELISNVGQSHEPLVRLANPDGELVVKAVDCQS